MANQTDCKVEWWSVVPGLTKVEPIKDATKFMPEWFKHAPKYLTEDFADKGTIKNCPGFIDLYKNAIEKHNNNVTTKQTVKTLHGTRVMKTLL